MGSSAWAVAFPPLGSFTATKAPNFGRPTTVPSSHFSGSKSWNSSSGQLTSLMVTDIRCASTSTFSTRTMMTCPIFRCSEISSTRCSAIWEMGSSAWAVSFPPLGSFRATKAPNDCRPRTWALTKVSELMPSNALTSRVDFGNSRILFLFIVSCNFGGDDSRSTFDTHTVTDWPILTTSSTFSTLLSDILESGTRPSHSAPMSTKAPNGAALVTTPVSSRPTFSVARLMSAIMKSSSSPPRAATATPRRVAGAARGAGEAKAMRVAPCRTAATAAAARASGTSAGARRLRRTGAAIQADPRGGVLPDQGAATERR